MTTFSVNDKDTVVDTDKVLVIDADGHLVAVPATAVREYCGGSAPVVYPDIEATDVALSPVSPVVNVAATLVCTVKNVGDGPNSDGTVTFTGDGIYNPTTRSLPVLAPGEEGSVTTQATFGATGTKNVGFTVSSVTGEQVTTNNSFTTTVSVVTSGQTGPADLVVDDIIFSPASPTPSDNITISAVVRNAGGTAVPSGTIIGVGFRHPAGVNPPLCWTDTYTGGLAAGASVTLAATNSPSGSATIQLAAGSYDIEAWVDDVDRLGALEVAKGNNIHVETLVVSTGGSTKYVDVTPVDITFSPATATPGTTVTIGAVIANNGNIPVNGGSCQFKVNGSTVSTVALPAISAGGQQTVTTNWAASGAGTYDVQVVLINVTGNDA